MYVMSARQQRVSVELVGKAEVEERQRHLENLRVATLIYAGVCSTGPHGQLRAACPSTLSTIFRFEPYRFHVFCLLAFQGLSPEGEREFGRERGRGGGVHAESLCGFLPCFIGF